MFRDSEIQACRVCKGTGIQSPGLWNVSGFGFKVLGTLNPKP